MNWADSLNGIYIISCDYSVGAYEHLLSCRCVSYLWYILKATLYTRRPPSKILGIILRVHTDSNPIYYHIRGLHEVCIVGHNILIGWK